MNLKYLTRVATSINLASNIEYLIILININDIFININIILIWVGNPKPHLRRFRLAAGVLFVF